MDSAPTASGERPEDSIPALELWKAQLAYVSGTILAWGAVLLQFWPRLARLQTGAHIHALGRDEGGDGTAMSFYLLALVVAVGLGMLAFGAAHIVARGFWLARFLVERPALATPPLSDRIARSSYIVLHLFWATALFFCCLVPLSALSALLTTRFTESWGWPFVLGRIVASLLAFAPLYAAAVILWRRRRGSRAGTGLARRVGVRHLVAAYAALPLLWVLVLEFSHVATVGVERHVYSRRGDAHVVVTVELGGAVSNPAPAGLALAGAGASQPLPMREVSGGRYVAIVPTASLPPGDYSVTLSYPHGSVSSTFPYLRDRISRSVGFVIVE